MDWQPIETAPKDGTPILACNDSVPSFPPIVVNWVHETYVSEDSFEDKSIKGWALYFPNKPFWFFEPEPTHWQTLPAPPEVPHA